MGTLLRKLRIEHQRNPQPLLHEAIIEILELRIELRDALQVGYGNKANWPEQALALLEERNTHLFSEEELNEQQLHKSKVHRNAMP